MQKSKIIIFLKIGNKYYYQDNFHDNLIFINDCKYLSFIYEESFLFRDDIIYAPCLFKTFDYDNIIKNHADFSKFQLIQKKFFNQIKMLFACKINRSDYHHFIDTEILSAYYSIKLAIYQDLVDNLVPPDDYEYLRKAYVISETVANNNILKYNDENISIKYNPFTDFGRFGLKHNSFNILSLKKESRKNFQINKNYSFLEIDFNSFEIRVLFSLLKLKQPQEDLYDFIRINSKSELDRDSFKKDLIHKIYSQNEHKTILYSSIKKADFYNRFKINNGKVKNCFGKEMSCDEFHLFSRVIQSTGAYIFYNQIYKILEHIINNNMKSKILFCIHDSLCLAIHNEEMHKISEIINIYKDIDIAEIGHRQNYLCKSKIGKNYGEMKVYE
jgi:hypothetical protein